jgi:putative ABC transport system permease protein
MKDHFSLAFNNLRRRKLRSWLTMIGIFIGIAAVVALISLGQGLQNAIEEQFEQLGSDKITVMGKAGFIVSPIASELSSKPLTKKDIAIIEKIQGVEIVSGFLMKSLEIEFKKEKKDIIISGIETDDYQKMFKGTYEIYSGKDLKSKDKSKVIIGYNTANKDFNKKIIVGNKIMIAGKDFEVVGIMEKIGSPPDDSSIIMNINSLRELTNEPEIISMIFAKVKKGFEVDQVAENIEKDLKKYRNEKLKEDPKTFSVSTSEQLLETFGNILGVVQAVLVGIAGISLLVGGIGIMNTMYTAVIERTKEIGTMKAIGAKNSDILFIFLFESGLLGVVGGGIGILIGISLSKSAEYISKITFGTDLLQADTTMTLIGGALVFSFLIGTLSGVLPAMQAAKLKPADALRYE